MVKYPAMERRTWYVLHVKPRTEKKLNDFLAAMGVFHYLPLVRKETKVQRRKVVRHLPVFPATSSRGSSPTSGSAHWGRGTSCAPFPSPNRGG